jgi:hypothetical protein
MEPKQLDQLLEKIRATIQNADNVDEKGRKILQDLEQDISGLLEKTEKTPPVDSVLERMKNAMEHFEATHPILTAMLSDASAILSNAGI